LPPTKRPFSPVVEADQLVVPLHVKVVKNVPVTIVRPARWEIVPSIRMVALWEHVRVPDTVTRPVDDLTMPTGSIENSLSSRALVRLKAMVRANPSGNSASADAAAMKKYVSPWTASNSKGWGSEMGTPMHPTWVRFPSDPV